MTPAPACRSCGVALRERARFCDACGSSTAVDDAAKYQQVTVLFADVVRSMDIAAALDLERYREVLTELVDRSTAVVQRFGGGTVEYTGDGVMAVFGAPTALEDHARRACLAALAVQQEAGRMAVDVRESDGVDLQLRVGLNSGRVIAGDVGSRSLHYTATGEAVGLAQRMESVAPPGGVMLSQSTARLVDGVAHLGDSEWVRIKGFAEPVCVYRLLGMHTPRSRASRAEASMFGRQWEMAALAAIVDRTIEGLGSAVHVVGPPGIGKSRMAREVAAAATNRGFEVFWAFCESHARDTSFGVVTQMLRALAGASDVEGAVARSTIRERFVDADPDDLALLYDLLGLDDPEPSSLRIDPDARRRRLTALICGAAMRRTEPALFVVEDAHWIDAVSETMLADVLALIGRTQITVLVTSRPEYRADLTLLPSAQRIALAPLAFSEISALLDELLGQDPSVFELAAMIAGRAAGNPFFAEEMVRDLAQRGVLIGQPGRYCCGTDVGEVDVPATVQAVIAARIDRLSHAAKQTVYAASVIGTRFSAELLLATLGDDAALPEVLEAELLDQVQFAAAAEYAFRHPLIRAVAYESQLKRDRTQWHRRVATVFQREGPEAAEHNATLIAQHLEAAGELLESYAWHMRSAARSAARDVSAARTSWQRACRIADSLPADDADHIPLRIAPRTFLCATDWQARPVQSSWGRFSELRELCAKVGDKASLAIGMTGLASELLYAGNPGEGAQLASEQMGLLESIGQPELTVGLSFLAFANWFNSGQFEDILAWSQVTIDLAAGDPVMGAGFGVGSPLAIATAFRGIARFWLGCEGWRRDLQEAVQLARGRDPGTLALVGAWTFLAVPYGVLKSDDATLRGIEAAVEAADRSSNDFALAGANFALGVALLYRENAEERRRGWDLMVLARDEGLPERAPSLVPLAKVLLARESAQRGERGVAIEVMGDAVRELREARRLGWGVLSTAILAETLLEGGGPRDVAEARAAIDWMASLQADQPSAVVAVTLARLRALLARAEGDDRAHAELVQRYRDSAATFGFEGHLAWSAQMA